MTRTFYGKGGGTTIVNLVSGEFLSLVTLGLFWKVGIPGNVTEEDCKIIARIIDNMCELQGHTPRFFTLPDIRLLNIDEVGFYRNLADWFENCGGTVSEEEYHKKIDKLEVSE